MSPTRRLLKKAKKGDISGALAGLEALLERKGPSPAIHGALGQVYLLDNHLQEAAAELRKALAMGRRSPAHLNALGWTLVRLGQLDDALPIAEEANRKAREDFEVYCLRCGLMAHHGRGGDVVQLFDFLKRTSAQIQKLNAKACQGGLGAKFEFARSQMNAAGFA